MVPTCNKVVNRHGNAGQVIAARGKARLQELQSRIINKPPPGLQIGRG